MQVTAEKIREFDRTVQDAICLEVLARQDAMGRKESSIPSNEEIIRRVQDRFRQPYYDLMGYQSVGSEDLQHIDI